MTTSADADGQDVSDRRGDRYGSAHIVSPALISAADHYRKNFGWDVEIQDRRIELKLAAGLAAVSMPFHTGQYLLQTAGVLPGGPLLLLPGVPFRVCALVESDDVIVLEDELPDGIQYHSPPSTTFLPPSVLRRGVVKWLREPSPSDRWLPLASGVLFAFSRPWIGMQKRRR
ncbi:hypothetical protein [Amycolatopsis thailandensis]|uniref:hypothetical protein n=1 Tax=Amycolatopsis thailandensis TaxID=589330 RepID=UPI0036323B3D